MLSRKATSTPWYFTINVQCQGAGLWAVERYDSCLGADGTWADGVKPHGRGERWLKTHRFDLDTALRLAEKAAAHVVVNGYSVTDLLTAEKADADE